MPVVISPSPGKSGVNTDAILSAPTRSCLIEYQLHGTANLYHMTQLLKDDAHTPFVRVENSFNHHSPSLMRGLTWSPISMALSKALFGLSSRIFSWFSALSYYAELHYQDGCLEFSDQESEK
jgi:hypothetical protein